MNIVERFESRRNWRYLAQAEIDSQGGLKLIYIDPPFDVGTDFSMDIEIGGDTFTKKPNILEEIAYRDTWGKGADSFIAMIHERLILMRDLLAECGTIYVHMGPTVNHLVRGVMDEVFGQSKLINEIIWKRRCSFMGTYNKFGSIRVPKEILPDGQPLLPGMKKD
ncbi:MAG TPA: DNA methyltransferase, partial [Planctomycetaceae bacterium]|nr:DNA methyltransferase [Planctomycetaceae bacterium]